MKSLLKFGVLLFFIISNAYARDNEPLVRGGYETWAQPSVVGLYFKVNGSYVGLCTGVLVAKRMVLTAAHCNKSSEAYVRFDILGSQGNQPRYVQIKSIRNYSNSTEYLGSDIAVAELSGDAPDGVSPVTIVPPETVSNTSTQKIVGYGYDGKNKFGKKAEAFVEIWSADCTQKFKQGDASVIYGCASKREMIAGNMKTLADSCPGDSGGPVFVSMSEGVSNWGLVAIVSRGLKNKNLICGKGGIYTLVGVYEEWLYGNFNIPKSKSKPLKKDTSSLDNVI